MIKLNKSEIENLIPHRKPMLLVDELYEKGKAINAASLLEFDTVLDPVESRDWISMVAESPIDSSEKVLKNRYIDSW